MKNFLKKSSLLLVLLLVSWSNLPSTQFFLNLKDTSLTLELNESYDIKKFIRDGSYDSISYPIVNTNVVGESIIYFRIQKNNHSLTKPVKLIVKDTTPPTFTTFEKVITLTQGETIDLEAFFSGTDNYSKEVNLEFEGTFDPGEAKEYPMKAKLKDEFDNETVQEFTIVVNQPAVTEEPVAVLEETYNVINTNSTQTFNIQSSSNTSNSFSGRLTLYGMDCVGCINYDGVAYTSTGIGLKENAVLQPDGTWNTGITYNGRYIFGSNSAHQRCTLVTVTNHGYSGAGISVNEPIYGVIADIGYVSYEHLDLFAGSEKNLLVSIVDGSVTPQVTITGYGTFTGSGCAF